MIKHSVIKDGLMKFLGFLLKLVLMMHYNTL